MSPSESSQSRILPLNPPMNNDSCLLMHPPSSDGMRDDMHDTTSESGSDRSEASRSSRQTNEHAPDVRSSCSPAGASPLPQTSLTPSLRKVTAESEYRGPSGVNDAQRPSAECRKRSSPGAPDETYQADEGREEDLKSVPQHEDLKSAPQPEEWDTHDADFETSLISQHNRRVIMTRLYETAPRGRLSLLNLTRRGVGVEDAKLLKQVIYANPLLCVLKLSYNALGDEGAAIIASALQLPNGEHHGHLSVLDLGFNSIGDKGCEALAVHSLAGNYNLQTLYLSGNHIGEKGALSIAGAILHGSALLNLYLSANNLGPIGMKAIAGAIAENDVLVSSLGAVEAATKTARSMQELHVGSSSIRSEGFIAIPTMLLTNSSLRSLCVVNNGIDDDDLALLAQALSQNKKLPLETLRLSFNEITCVGVEHLMNAIWGSPTLRELKLDNNRIQDRGAQLCAVVLTSISLEILDLSLNRITTVGIKALMKNLSENISLLSLGLTGITIDQNASKAVSFALAYNSSLQSIYIDNCSAGYASQRHIVAGVVSNRTSSLRVLAGFHLAPIAITLGMPRLPAEWTNDQVLGFFRVMWQQWLFKAGRGSGGSQDTRGPAPPAAVAAAAKIALASLGNSPETLFHTQPHEKPVGEGPPVDPINVALLERTDSGTLCVPVFADSSDDRMLEMVVDDVKESTSSFIHAVRGPLDNAERRNQNLKWLKQHFRSLNDVGKLPFNNADLWQLHQYYFSPPYQNDDRSSTATESDGERSLSGESDAEGCAPPPTPFQMSKSPSLGRAVSFQTLGDAFAASGVISKSNAHKRRSFKPDEEDVGPAAKRAKSLKPRIAYYPRIMVQLESLGKRPMEETLALLRQLKYTENVMFAGSKDPYTNSISSIREEVSLGREASSHSDVEMILLDLL